MSTAPVSGSVASLSPAYRAAEVGLRHRLALFGVDICYTRVVDCPSNPRVHHVRCVLNAVNSSRGDNQPGGSTMEHDATLRLPRTIGFKPVPGDLVTLATGANYRVATVADHPTQPEFRLALTTEAN
jgi:hypothetical protein